MELQEKLNGVFKVLRRYRMIVRQNLRSKSFVGSAECEKIASKVNESPHSYFGYACYCLPDDGKNIFINFDAPEGFESSDVGLYITSVLKNNGVEYKWDGSGECAIEVIVPQQGKE